MQALLAGGAVPNEETMRFAVARLDSDWVETLLNGGGKATPEMLRSAVTNEDWRIMQALVAGKAVNLAGAEAVAGLLMVGTISGVLLAMLMNNGGGAWDNAKKYIESGAHGGKRSEAHKAAVVGDTVGDPFKDTAGPSLHVLIKLLATVTLVLAPLFV